MILQLRINIFSFYDLIVSLLISISYLLRFAVFHNMSYNLVLKGYSLTYETYLCKIDF